MACIERPEAPNINWLVKRLASRAARFKCAVTLGFMIAALGFLAAGPGNRALSAEEAVWGSISGLFGQTDYQARAPLAPADYDMGRPRLSRHTIHRHVARAYSAATRHGSNASIASASGQQSMCVRLCDGYVFPVGTYHGDGDTTAHAAICQSTCPGAATALYVMPTGAQLRDAVAVDTGEAYSRLPDAFHYTTLIDDACTCQKAGAEGKRLSLLKDFTLRRGDAVMTPRGVKVFHGRGHFPYRGTDFVALARSPDVRKIDRETFGAIERASLRAIDTNQPRLSKSQPAGSNPTSPAAALPRFEKRASRD